ncbi:hypothetical protein [uncultured Sphingomonas sp.]|uniref:hypothetical protein n=1 Tax=uncultured Sphingomonas sp. TaxID=158754 RepID=UPI0025CD9F21|nr:hypothetical protein [uncultured Sphingomonas sp.]
MPYTAFDFGSSAPNDGEMVESAFRKQDAMNAELYSLAGSADRMSWSAFPAGSSTALVFTGANGVTNNATYVSRDLATELKKRSAYYFGSSSDTATTASSSLRGSTFAGYRGSEAGRGGFTVRYQFGFDRYNAGHRFFAGLAGAAQSPPPVAIDAGSDPSSASNIFGFGKDAGDSDMSIITTASNGTVLKTPLTGITTAALTIYDVILSCPMGVDQALHYEVRTVTGVTATGQDTYGATVWSGDIPATAAMPATNLNLWLQLAMGVANSGATARFGIVALTGRNLSR